MPCEAGTIFVSDVVFGLKPSSEKANKATKPFMIFTSMFTTVQTDVQQNFHGHVKLKINFTFNLKIFLR